MGKKKEKNEENGFVALLKAPAKQKRMVIAGIKKKLATHLAKKGIREYVYVVEHHMMGNSKRVSHRVHLEIHQKDPKTGEIVTRRRENIKAITNVYVTTLDDKPIIGAYSYCASCDTFSELNGELVAMRKLHTRLLGK